MEHINDGGHRYSDSSTVVDTEPRELWPPKARGVSRIFKRFRIFCRPNVARTRINPPPLRNTYPVSIVKFAQNLTNESPNFQGANSSNGPHCTILHLTSRTFGTEPDFVTSLFAAGDTLFTHFLWRLWCVAVLLIAQF